MFEENPNNFNDIASPGTTAAAPFSRPIIVTDQPIQADPMVAENPTDLASRPPESIQTFADMAAAEAANTPDHFHSLQHDQSIVEHIEKQRTSILGVLATVLLMAAAGFLGYYLTKVYLIK